MSELLQIIQKLLGAGQKRAAQRVERLADEVPNVDLQFRPETIESVAQDMRTPMSAMSPRLFEQYAQPLPPEYEMFMRRGDAPKWENVKSLMEDGAPQFDDLPYLSISKQLPYHRRKTFAQTADTFLPRVDSHEGRHRMRGLGGEFGTSALRLFPRSPSLNREIRNLSPDEQLDASIKWLESHEGILPESANGRQDKRLLRPNIFKPFADGGAVESFDPEGPGYDLPSAQAAGMRPDAEGHMGSVAPTLEEQIYLLLKGRQHPTWDKAVDAENMRGSAVEKRDDGRYYSVPFAPGGGYADGGTPGHVHETRSTWTPPSFPELPTIHDLLMKREYTPAIVNTLNPLATEGEDPIENTISRLGGLALSAAGTRLAAPVADLALDAGKRLYGGLSRTAPAAGAVAVMEPEDAEANPLKTKFLDMARAAATPKGTFSPAARAIASAPQDMTGEQWANFLRGRMADVGGQKFPVRPDELEFTGLGELLAQYGTKPVGRGALLDFLAAKKPESVYNEEMEQLYKTARRRGLTDQENDRLAQLQEAANPGASPLLSRGATYPRHTQLGDVDKDFPDADGLPRYSEHQLPGPRSRYSEELTSDRMFGDLNYNAPHFGPEGHGLISHSRMSTRPTVDGGKAVHIDEIQSDLHQKARDEGGYGSPEAIEKLRELDRDSLQLSRERARLKQDEFPAWAREYDAFATKHKIGQIPKEEAEKIPGFLEFRARYDKLSKREQEIDEEFDLLNNERLRLKDAAKRPPRAPYQDRYHEVEFNKALRRAVDEDADVVTWTTGDQQAQRWNQQVQGGVKRLELGPEGLKVTKPDGTVQLLPREKDGTFAVRHVGEPVPLQELLGNSLAKKLEKEGVLEGENLSLGGGGFKNFYDGTINKYAESWARRFPGAEVKGAKLQGPTAVRSATDSTRLAADFRDSVGEGSDDLLYLLGDLDATEKTLANAEKYADFNAIPRPDREAFARAVQKAHVDQDIEMGMVEARDIARTAFNKAREFLSTSQSGHQVHSLRLTPELKAWIKQHGTPIMSVAPAAAVGSETLDRIEQLLGERE